MAPRVFRFDVILTLSLTLFFLSRVPKYLLYGIVEHHSDRQISQSLLILRCYGVYLSDRVWNTFGSNPWHISRLGLSFGVDPQPFDYRSIYTQNGQVAIPGFKEYIVNFEWIFLRYLLIYSFSNTSLGPVKLFGLPGLPIMVIYHFR